MKFFRPILIMLVVGFAHAAPTPVEPPVETPEELLFYESENPFAKASRWEFRGTTGIDFSNPYAFIYAGGGGVSYALDRTISLGAEFTAYASQARESAKVLDEVLNRYGYDSDTVYPQYSSVGVVRLTPISGLVNFLSRGVLLADISLLLRGGMIHYRGLGNAPLVGTGIEVHLGVTPHFGVAGSLLWEAQQPPGYRWESRVGFRVGPTWRF